MGRPKNEDALDEAVKERVREMREGGHSMANIAAALGVCERTVMRYMRSMGMRATQVYVSDEALVSMHSDGMTLGQMIRRTGLTEATLRQRLSRVGIKRADLNVEPKAVEPKAVEPTMFRPTVVLGSGPLAERFNRQQAELWANGRPDTENSKAAYGRGYKKGVFL